jgi:His Kinase A (phospho-acceptor) domain
MNPMIQSRSFRAAWDRLSQAQSFPEFCAEFSNIIGNHIPFDAGLYFPSKAGSIHDRDRTGIKSNADYVRELASRLQQPQDKSAPEENAILALPIVHAGNVEAICCLKRRTTESSPLSPPQIFDLISICDIAGKSIARLNKSINDAGNDAGKDNRLQEFAQQQLLGAIFSKALGSVAHDLRTPITVIRGFIKMILDGRAGAVSDAQRKCLEVAIESVNRLVEFSGTVGGAAAYLEQFQIDEFEILEAWTSVSNAIRPQLEEKSVSVSEFIEPGLMVAGDRKLLFGVVEKSILAMIAALQPGGRLRIEISRRSSGDVSFQISLPEERDCGNPAAVVTQLQPVVLLHGGRLSYTVKPESGAVLNLILPGCAA